MANKKLRGLENRVKDIYIQIELDIIESIISGISKQDTKNKLSDAPDLWKLEKMDQLGMLEGDMIDKIIMKSGIAHSEIEEMFKKANLISRDNEKSIMSALEDAGRTHLIADEDGNYTKNQSNTGVKILKTYQKSALDITNLTNQTLISKGKQMYIDGLDKSATEMLFGLKSSTQVKRDLINDWVDKGIPVFTDKAGRNWSAESYLGTVLKTQSTNMVRDITFNSYEERGIELIEVSKHPGDRPGCAPYAGGIFSLKPDHPDYPYLYDPEVGRIGDPDSLFGINCGHVSYAYIEGVTPRLHYPSDDPEEDARIYEESQKQRGYERAIRQAKAKEKMLRETGDIEGADRMAQLVRSRQARMRKFIDKTGRTRRYDREGVWSPSTAGDNKQSQNISTKDIRRGDLQEFGYDLEKNIQSTEEEIRKLSKERAYLYNDSGEVIWKNDGNSNSVDLSDAARRNLLKDNVLTHNHPGSTSFSHADIDVMLRNKMKEIRAIGKNDNLVRAKLRDGFTEGEVAKYIKDNIKDIENEVKDFLWGSIKDGLIPNDMAAIEHWNEVWNRVAARTGLDYERVLSKEYEKLYENLEGFKRRSKFALQIWSGNFGKKK